MGPKELVGLVGTVTDGLPYTPPTPRFTEVEAYFFTTCRYIVMTWQILFLPQDVVQRNNPFMATCADVKIVLTRTIEKHVLSLFKTCAFRYQISQNMCFDITFCTGSGRRTPALKFMKNSYGVVAPHVVWSLPSPCGSCRLKL